MTDIDPAVRVQLATLARRKRSRVFPYPARWNPESVRRLDGLEGYFTSASAWEYVADLLDEGHPVETIILENPPGRTGFVMLVDMPGESRQLYIKIQLGSGKIIGRSFHYSVYSEKKHD